MKSNFTGTHVRQTRRLAVGAPLAIVAALFALLSGQTFATPARYDFRLIAALDQPAPGGGAFTHDFEPSFINNRGEVLFIADVTTGGEGLFLGHGGDISQIARAGQAAPGGGTFDSAVFGPCGMNQEGDVAGTLILSPFSFPFGVNAGLYRRSHNTEILTQVVVPNVTAVPGAGVTFAGAGFSTRLNNQGDIVFSAPFSTDKGIHVPGEDYVALGVGIFLADQKGQIHSIVRPGDPAPGGGSFDYGDTASINDAGDIAFDGHIAGEECITFLPQSVFINCAESIFLRKAATGTIQLVAHQGTGAPGGGFFRHLFGATVNARDQVLFIGDLTEPPGYNEILGVYFYNGSEVVSVAHPGQPMPGGGLLLTASALEGNFFVNNSGEVVFNATLDTGEQAVYSWFQGSLSAVVRSGTVIPGLGVVDKTTFGSSVPPGFPLLVTPSAGVVNNDRGQILFGVTLLDGRGVLLMATPKR